MDIQEYIDEIEKAVKQIDGNYDLLETNIPLEYSEKLYKELKKKGYNAHYQGEQFGIVTIRIYLKRYEARHIENTIPSSSE